MNTKSNNSDVKTFIRIILICVSFAILAVFYMSYISQNTYDVCIKNCASVDYRNKMAKINSKLLDAPLGSYTQSECESSCNRSLKSKTQMFTSIKEEINKKGFLNWTKDYFINYCKNIFQ